MRVYSLIKRPNGHVVNLDGVAYAFLPPDWCCEVAEPRHLARFQAITEGYRLDEPLPSSPTRLRGRPRKIRPAEAD